MFDSAHAIDVSNALATWVTGIATVVTAFVAYWGFTVAKKQLVGMNRSLQTGNLVAILTIEADLSARKEKVDDLLLQIKRLDQQPFANVNERGLLMAALDTAVENWLNVLERLCYCINMQLLPERDWRLNYQQYIEETIHANPDFFTVNSRYVNILAVHQSWVSGKRFAAKVLPSRSSPPNS